jgi:hypothetical protein
MALTLGPILADAGIDLTQAIVMRHAYTTEIGGIHADSTDEKILAYTAEQSASASRFLAAPPQHWVVFIREGGAEARLWSVVENRGEVWNNGTRRGFDVVRTDHMAELRNRLVVGWRSPRTWWMRGVTAASYPVNGIADAEPIPFPGFDKLVLSYARLQAVMREPRYASWNTAMSAVKGIYLITDTRDGRHYVGKADGLESIRQRWSAYAANGHGGNVELRGLDPSTFRYSLLRVFDPSTPTAEINDAEGHYKLALDSRVPHGLNRN